MIKDIQTASFFLKDGLNDNSEFRWCFCMGDEGFGDEGFAESNIGGPETAAPAPDAPVAEPSPEATRAAYEATTAATQAAGRSAAATGNVGSPEEGRSVDYFDTQFEVDPFDIAEFNISAPKSNIDVLTRMAQENPKGFDRVQDLLNQRQFSTNTLGIPEMNILEKEGLNTFGLGYRGTFEARSPKGLSRDAYDPNTLTGAGTDAASDNRALFTSFARANPSLSTVEAMAQYNATSPQDQQVSISDVQNMGFELNAPVGPQADFREAEAQRGFGQGLGMIGRSLAFGPIGAMTDIALSGTGKGVLGHIGDMFEKASGYELPEVPDFGLPTIQGTVEDLVGPSKDTMDPASFGITGVTEETIGPEAFGFADISPPTNEEIGYTDMGLGSFTPDGNEFSQLPIPIQTQTAPVQEVQVAEKAAPRFPVRDTTPDSVIRTLAQIYKDDQGNPDEQRARELLGIGIA